MSDLPPFDDDEFFDEPEFEKPKRGFVNDDGELPFEVDVEKPKKRPPSRWWRKTYIPIPLLLGICALLICAAVLLLSTYLTNGSLLCRYTFSCAAQPVARTAQPTLGHDPRPPLNEVRVAHFTAGNGSDTTYDSTYTPAPYTMPLCDFNADYRSHLMFTMGVGDNAEIFLMTPQGASVCRLTQNLIEEKGVNWSPDRKRILFTSQRKDDNHTDLYVMNFDGTNIINLTQDQAEDYSGAWSSDGKRIAFASTRSGAMHVFVMNADGSNVSDVTPDAVTAQQPSWSPDGTQIAYIQGFNNNGSTFEVYTVNLNTKATHRFTNDSSPEYMPVWSPQGTALVFYANTVSQLGDQLGTDLYRLPFGGNSMEQLTGSQHAGVHFAQNPTWSPDGAQVAYLESFEIQILDLATHRVRSVPTMLAVLDTVSWR